MTFEEYKKSFFEDIQNNAIIHHTTTDEEFLDKTLTMLESSEVIHDPVSFYYKSKCRGNRVMEISGYAYDFADKSLTLIYNDFSQTVGELEPLTNTRIDIIYKRLLAFLETVEDSSISDYADMSNEIINIAIDMKRRLDMKYAIGDTDETIEKIQMCIITNSELSTRVKNIQEQTFLDKKVTLNLWSIERFYEIASNGEGKEPIEIKTSDHDLDGIQYIKANITGTNDYDAYLAIVPGKFLADIYYDYGARLLEGNVRSFLSIKGKINAQIRKTIKEDPTKFFTYNNGISATASSIQFSEDNSKIIELNDLQIINGGQTTASLTSAYIKDHADLSNVFVQMKLTVIHDRSDNYGMMIQNIAKYANSQNKVTDADLFSSHPFHIAFEKLSDLYFTPIIDGNIKPTKWFYERTRGGYTQRQFKMTPKSKEDIAFKETYPKNQVIKKEELAKYWETIQCKPNIVCKGSAAAMSDFAEEIDDQYKKDPSVFNERFFKKAVAAAIIFRETDKLIYNEPWYTVNGNKSDIIPYTISKIISSLPTGKTIDFDLIWKKQALYPSFIEEIHKVSALFHDVISQPNIGIPNEYCKKASTWESFKVISYEPSEEFLNDSVSLELEASKEKNAQIEQKEADTVNIISQIFYLGSDYWRNLIKEGKERRLLTITDVELLNVAVLCNDPFKPRIPSNKQAEAIWKLRQMLSDNGVSV